MTAREPRSRSSLAVELAVGVPLESAQLGEHGADRARGEHGIGGMTRSARLAHQTAAKRCAGDRVEKEVVGAQGEGDARPAAQGGDRAAEAPHPQDHRCGGEPADEQLRGHERRRERPVRDDQAGCRHQVERAGEHQRAAP